MIHNLCHQSRPDLWPVGKMLYLDGTSSGIKTFGNIGWNVTGNVIDNNDGHDNHHFGNIGIDGTDSRPLNKSFPLVTYFKVIDTETYYRRAQAATWAA